MELFFSIIIPVLNEASTINKFIRHVFGVTEGFEREVIVVDGSPGAETISTIENYHVRKLASGKGRGKQMNMGASIASGDILVFLHADTLLPEGALGAICTAIDEGFAGGAFALRIDSGRFVFRIIEKGAWLRQKITGVPYGDQAIFMRKDYFGVTGGFREIPLMEDVELIRRVKKSGGRICLLPQKVLTSPRRWEKEGVLCCTSRNWMLISLYYMGMKPEKLVKFYYPD